MAGIIDAYLVELRSQLAFDPSLASRLSEEIEGHLREAAEADPAWPSPDAEHRAVARFGLAREIAAQFAADGVNRQARRTWLTLLAALIVTFVAMRLRVVWLDDVGEAMSALAPFVDRYGFVCAISVASIGWLVLRHSMLPIAVCLGGLVASIAAGFVRADLFANGAPAFVLMAAAGEIALIGLLAWHAVGLGRRLKRASLLQGSGR